jgi:hypothetical protein
MTLVEPVPAGLILKDIPVIALAVVLSLTMLINLSPSPRSLFATNAVFLVKAIVVPKVDLDPPPP